MQYLCAKLNIFFYSTKTMAQKNNKYVTYVNLFVYATISK